MAKEAPVSERTRKGMTLTIDDRKFIKVQNDYILDVVSEKITDNVKYIAEIIMASNEKMFNFMDEIRIELKKIGKRLDNHETRIRNLEDCLKLNKSA